MPRVKKRCGKEDLEGSVLFQLNALKRHELVFFEVCPSVYPLQRKMADKWFIVFSVFLHFDKEHLTRYLGESLNGKEGGDRTPQLASRSRHQAEL